MQQRIAPTTTTRTEEAPSGAALLEEILADVQAAGRDTTALSNSDRSALLVGLARRLGLNPLSNAVVFLRTQGREVLYVTKSGTDQIAARERLSRRTIRGPEVVVIEGKKIVLCAVEASHPDGRSEVSTATIPLADPTNDLMKCETKAKRRATLSVCGLGLLAEDEIDQIPGAVVEHTPRREPVADVERAAIQSEPAPLSAYEKAEHALKATRSLSVLAAAWRVIQRECWPHLGAGERSALTALKDRRKSELTPSPDGTDGTPRASSNDDAQGTTAEGAQGDGATAQLPDWARTADGQRAHLATKTAGKAALASVAKWGSLVPGYADLAAERLQALSQDADGAVLTIDVARKMCDVAMRKTA